MMIDFFKSIQIVQSAIVNEYFMINLKANTISYKGKVRFLGLLLLKQGLQVRSIWKLMFCSLFFDIVYKKQI